MVMTDKLTILKEKMSEPYCKQTRFDFLDPEEIIMILYAMEAYAEKRIQEQLNYMK